MHTMTRYAYLIWLTGLSLTSATLGHAQGRGGGGGGHAGGGAGGGGFGAGGPPASMPAARPSTPPASRPATTPPSQAQHGSDTAAQHGAAPAARQLADTMKSINQSSFDARMQLLKTADMSLKENRDALKKIQSDARKLRADARETFKAALDEVKTKDAELADSIKEARHTDAAGWEKSREKLAAAHQHYQDAMARLETARKNGETPPKG